MQTLLAPLDQQGRLNEADISYFNQDTVRDNFSAITLLIESAFDGSCGPGGALPNQLL